MPVPINQAGYTQDFMGFGIQENLVPLDTYSQMLKAPFINSTPVPYPSGERLKEGEFNREADMKEYIKEDPTDEQDETYYERAVNFMGERSRSLLDVNNDGVLDGGDIKAMASNIAGGVKDAVKSVKGASEEVISDVGAESIKKSGAIDEFKAESQKTMVLLREKTDLALLKVDEVASSVDSRLGDVNQTLMYGFGALAVAYVVFSRD
mgnify:CR=1 FL=1